MASDSDWSPDDSDENEIDELEMDGDEDGDELEEEGYDELDGFDDDEDEEEEEDGDADMISDYDDDSSGDEDFPPTPPAPIRRPTRSSSSKRVPADRAMSATSKSTSISPSPSSSGEGSSVLPAKTAFSDLITIPHYVPNTPFEFILHIYFGIMYGRMMARTDSTYFWSELLKVEHEESWWHVFRGYLRTEMIPLLVCGQPPTAWDLAEVGWLGNGVGVYIKIGLGQDGKESMLYIGSASYFPLQSTHVYGLDKRRRQHEYALAGTKKESSMFTNIQLKHPNDREVVFSTLFRIPLDLDSASSKDLSGARIMARFGEGILSEWLQAWNPNPEYNRLGKIPDRLGHELWPEYSFTYFGTLGHSQFAEPFKLPSGHMITRTPEEYKEYQRKKWTRDNNTPKAKKRQKEWKKKNQKPRTREQLDRNIEQMKKKRESLSAEQRAIVLREEKARRDNRPENYKAFLREYSSLHFKGLNTPERIAALRHKHGLKAVVKPVKKGPST